MLGLGCVPALALAFGMLRMPQSPRWLVMKGDDFAARATLAKIRVDDPDTIDRELEEIKGSLDAKPGAWSDLLQPAVKAALVVGIGLAILQQITGINTVIYYAPTIVEFTGVSGTTGPILAAVGVGIINVGDDPGRDPAARPRRAADPAADRRLRDDVSLFALGVAFVGGGGCTVASVVAIASLMVFVACFAFSLGPIFWLLNAEIYPLGVRSKAAGLGTMANWTFNFIVSLTFLLLIEALGQSGTFFLYAAIGVLTLVFCWKLVPETKGKRLEDIQAYFEDGSGRPPPRRRPSGVRAPASAYPASMRVDEIITAQGPTFSIEFFPPKSDGGDGSSCSRRRARWASWSPTSSRSPTAPAARPATARSRSPGR